MRMSLLAVGFLVFTLCGAAHADEATAIKMVENLGGKALPDIKQPRQPIIRVDLRQTKVKDADLKELKNLTQLKRLDLRETKVTDAGLKELKGLKQLIVLSLD